LNLPLRSAFLSCRVHAEPAKDGTKGDEKARHIVTPDFLEFSDFVTQEAPVKLFGVARNDKAVPVKPRDPNWLHKELRQVDSVARG